MGDGLDVDAQLAERDPVEGHVLVDQLTAGLWTCLAVDAELTGALEPADAILALGLGAEVRHGDQHHAIFGSAPALLGGHTALVEGEPGVDVVHQVGNGRLGALERELIVEGWPTCGVGVADHQ
jgi:hypothetical protein